MMKSFSTFTSKCKAFKYSFPLPSFIVSITMSIYVQVDLYRKYQITQQRIRNKQKNFICMQIFSRNFTFALPEKLYACQKKFCISPTNFAFAKDLHSSLINFAFACKHFVPLRNLAFAHLSFVSPQKTKIVIPHMKLHVCSQKFCASQRNLTLARNPFAFPQKILHLHPRFVFLHKTLAFPQENLAFVCKTVTFP